MYYSELERLCIDDWKVYTYDGNWYTGPQHSQRVDHFLNVSIKAILKYAFQLCINWYPQTDGVDSTKWFKFAKDIKLFPDIHKPRRQAQVDLAFKRQLGAQNERREERMRERKVMRDDGQPDRRLNAQSFQDAIQELTMIRYPHMNDT